jgi:hypothetical protein
MQHVLMVIAHLLLVHSSQQQQQQQETMVLSLQYVSCCQRRMAAAAAAHSAAAAAVVLALAANAAQADPRFPDALLLLLHSSNPQGCSTLPAFHAAKQMQRPYPAAHCVHCCCSMQRPLLCLTLQQLQQDLLLHGVLQHRQLLLRLRAWLAGRLMAQAAFVALQHQMQAASLQLLQQQQMLQAAVVE